jgi:hypothetical protein
MLRPRMTRAAAAGVLALLASVGVAGCSSPTTTTTATATATASASGASPAATEQVAPGDIPDTQAFVTAKAPSGRWAIKVPEGWSQRTVTAGLQFTDKLNVIQAIERTAAQAPTVASVTSADVAALRASRAGVTVGTIAPFTRAGGSGVVLQYQADSAKDPVTGKVHRDAAEEYLFFKNGREVAVTVSGAIGADNVDPWKIVTNSFRWLR